MYNLPFEIQDSIFKNTDAETCMKNKHYYGIEKFTGVNLLSVALRLKDIEYYYLLKGRGYKPDASTLQFAIYNNLDVVKDVLESIDRSKMYHNMMYIQCAELNGKKDIQNYLEINLK